MKEKILENEEIKSSAFATIKTEEKEETILLEIYEQENMDFTYNFKVNEDGSVELSDSYSYWDIQIASIDCVEYTTRGTEKPILFLKGATDIHRECASVEVPKDKWPLFKAALIQLGAYIDCEPEKENQNENGVDYTFNLTPTEEEIEEMISLVNLDTFNRLIKTRLYEELNEDERSTLGKINRKWAKEYLRKWAISKFRFYKMFGNKLTISKEVEGSASIDDTSTLLNELCAEFPLYSPIIHSIPYKFIQENKISNAREMSCGLNRDTRIVDGMSLTKFISFYNNKELDIAFSKFYQDKGKNTLHISINPIDYLTVSINASGWESCHHFMKGCYKNAGLSYMFDDTSFIAYGSRKDIEYSSHGIKFKWNTKNWRQMIFMSRHGSGIVFSRQYPSKSEEYAKQVRAIVEELVSNYYKTENKWVFYKNEERARLRVHKDSDYSLVYNDIANGFEHTAVRAKNDVNKDIQYIYIGEAVPFLLDKERYYHNSEQFLMGWCNRCEDCECDGE